MLSLCAPQLPWEAARSGLHRHHDPRGGAVQSQVAAGGRPTRNDGNGAGVQLGWGAWGLKQEGGKNQTRRLTSDV